MLRFQLIDQKLNSKGFLRPLAVAHLFKIQFFTKKFLAKIFIKMHRFQLIYKKLNFQFLFDPVRWHVCSKSNFLPKRSQ